MLATQALIQTHLGVDAVLAGRVFVHGQPQAAAQLRAWKGALWYDAVLLAEPEEPLANAGVHLRVMRPAAGEHVTVGGPGIAVAGSARVDGYPAGTPAGTPVQLHAVTYWVARDIFPGDALGTGSLGGAGLARHAWRRAIALPGSMLVEPVQAWRLTVEARDASGRYAWATWRLSPVGSSVAQGYTVTLLSTLNGVTVVPESATAAVVTRDEATQAECLLALYYALPMLNLRVDAAGGLVTQMWVEDAGTGARTQTTFASPERVASLREDLMQQALLLVGERTPREAVDGGLLDVGGLVLMG